MIQNRKLFFITLIVAFLLCLAVDVPALMLGFVKVGTLVNGLFYIGNAIFGAIVYTLLFQSLKKTELVKKIYRFTIVIAIMVFVIGTIILFVNIF